MGAFCAGLSQAAVGQPNRQGNARSVILIFNFGGPSHIDLWDPKPAASNTVRGPFQTIDTKVPGIQVTELIPKLAQWTDKLAIVRTVHHTHSGHNSGMHWSIDGRPMYLSDGEPIRELF